MKVSEVTKLENKGKSFSAFLEGVFMLGKIQIEDGRVYLCHHLTKFDITHPADMLGYSSAYWIGNTIGVWNNDTMEGFYSLKDFKLIEEESPDNLLDKDGWYFTATICAKKVINGRIRVLASCSSSHRVYLCQNIAQGHPLGSSVLLYDYKYSWGIGTGSSKDLKRENVKDLQLFEEDPNKLAPVEKDYSHLIGQKINPEHLTAWIRIGQNHSTNHGALFTKQLHGTFTEIHTIESIELNHTPRIYLDKCAPKVCLRLEGFEEFLNYMKESSSKESSIIPQHPLIGRVGSSRDLQDWIDLGNFSKNGGETWTNTGGYVYGNYNIQHVDEKKGIVLIESWSKSTVLRLEGFEEWLDSRVKKDNSTPTQYPLPIGTIIPAEVLNRWTAHHANYSYDGGRVFKTSSQVWIGDRTVIYLQNIEGIISFQVSGTIGNIWIREDGFPAFLEAYNSKAEVVYPSIKLHKEWMERGGLVINKPGACFEKDLSLYSTKIGAAPLHRESLVQELTIKQVTNKQITKLKLT